MEARRGQITYYCKRLQIQGLFCCAVLWRLTSDLFAVNLFIRRDLLSKVGRYVARFQILKQKEKPKALIPSFSCIQRLIFCREIVG